MSKVKIQNNDKVIRMHKLEGKPYFNGLMLDPDGKPMCRVGFKRLKWYVKRNLATVVQEEPLVIQLKFKPNGPGNHGDPYMMEDKVNRCVVCGSQENLTKHHVVPYCYRSKMPDTLKNHASYDILLLCIPCHDQYERKSHGLRQSLAHKYNAPIQGVLSNLFADEMASQSDPMSVFLYKVFENKSDSQIKSIQGLCWNILEHGSKMPNERLLDMLDNLSELVGKELSKEITVKEMKQMSLMKFKKTLIKTHAEMVMERVKKPEELIAFIKMWRKHFIDTMTPKFLSDKWEVDGNNRIIQEYQLEMSNELNESVNQLTNEKID